MLAPLVLDGRSGQRPGSPPFDPDPHQCPDRAPHVREGPVRSLLPMSFDHPRAGARAPPRRRRPGLHRTHPRPGARPSRSSSPAATSWPAPRPAPARRPPSCCRCSSGSARRTPIRAPAARPIRALVLAPTRELALQVEESVRDYGRHAADPLDRHLRRRRLRPAGPRAARRPRDRRRHARPPARPPRPAHDRPVARSRSSSSTRPTGCSTWASSATSARSSRSLPARRQNLLFSATFSDEIRSLAEGFLHDPASVQVTPAQHGRAAGHAGRPPGRPRAQARAAEPPRSGPA